MDINTESCSKTDLKKHLFTVKPGRKDGLTLKIHHTVRSKNKPSLIRFLHASFNWTGNVLAAANHCGDLFIINFAIEKFWFLDTVSSVSVLKFLPKRENEFIVGEYGGAMHVLNAEMGMTGVTLRAHDYAVTDISFSSNNRCISTTGIDAIIWDLATYKMVQVLQPESGNNIKLAIFIPVSNDILACFQDDVIQIWKADSFEPLKQILPSTMNKMQVKSIAFTQNGQAMIIGGHSCNLIVFIIEIWAVVQTIPLPPNFLGIKKLEFVSRPFDGGANKILVILSSNGSLLFYDMEADAVVGRLRTEREIVKFSMCQQGKQIACIMNNGEIYLYNLRQYMTVPSKVKDKSTYVNRPVRKVDFDKRQVKEVLDLNKLKGILREFGEYPDLYRKTIWTSVLSLPNDKQQYDRIVASTYESPYNNLEQNYPMANKQDLRNLKRTLQNIVSWCPFFAKVTYLPLFTFPFVRLFQNEPILCFEALIVIIVNYCQYWFEYHPLPPLNILGIIENVLMEHDRPLLSHFTTHKVSSKTFAWPLLQSVCSEILSSQEWLVLWDHVLSNEPSFLLMAVVAYSMISRSTLLTFNKKNQFEVYFHNQNPIDFKRFISKIYSLVEETGVAHHPRQYLELCKKPSEGTYPKFEDMPRVHLEYNEQTDELRQEGEVLLQEPKLFERENEESLRLSEMQKIYQDKIKEEHHHALYQKGRLQQLSARLKSDESDVTKKKKVRSDGDKELGAVNENNKVTGQEVKRIEQELLEHYTVLLKHKLQIEKLSGGDLNVDYSQLKEDYCSLTEEIEKARKMANEKQYLKQLNISTSIQAVNKLIVEVESELKVQASDSTGKASCSKKASLLATQTKELSEDLNKLIQLITKMK